MVRPGKNGILSEDIYLDVMVNNAEIPCQSIWGGQLPLPQPKH